jgi:hypothetical protein
MSAWKSLVLSVVIGGAVASPARADGLPWINGPWSWSSWTSGSTSQSMSNWNATGGLFAGYNAPAGTAPSAAPAASAALQNVNVGAPTATFAQALTASGLSTSNTPSIQSFTSVAAAPTVDAFLNFGTGPYANAGLITTGNGQAWYTSPQITGLFGGQPSSQQVAAFDTAIIQRVQQAFQLSGVSLSLTSDPSVAAAHSLSLVSNTVSNTLPAAIGMTELGGSGFSFIDNIAPAARSVDQLEWLVAHNISHELMLAFGVGEKYDQTGNFIDARNANITMMLDPNATFSQAATQALLATNFLSNNSLTSLTFSQGAQVIGPQVPEPATVILWIAGLAGAMVYRRRVTAK